MYGLKIPVDVLTTSQLRKYSLLHRFTYATLPGIEPLTGRKAMREISRARKKTGVSHYFPEIL